MKKFRRIISMLMILVLLIGILPMNLGVVKAEAELDETTKLKDIRARVYDGESWEYITFTAYVFNDEKHKYDEFLSKFDPNIRNYKINLDPKYKKIQFYIEKASEEQVVEIESGFAYKVRNSNYTEETALEPGKNTFKFFVIPSNGSATREHVFSIERGDVTKDRAKIHKLSVTNGSAEFYEAYEGDVVKIWAINKYKMVFDKWVIEDGNNIIKIEDGNSIIKEPDKTPTELRMPNSILTIKPTYKESVVNDSNLRDIVLYGLEDEVWKKQKSKLIFNKEQKTYTVDLSEDFSEGYLYLQFGDSEQSISVTLNNNVVASSKAYMPNGYETEKLKLNEGENTFKITVTSEDGTNTSVYTLIVNRGEVKYKVSFDANNGSGKMPDTEIEKGKEFELPENGFTAPDGQEFKAWEVDSIEYPAKTNIKINKETIVKAVWKDIEYKITFDKTEGSGEMDEQVIKAGKEFTLPENDFTAPENKEFAGWKIGEDEKKPGDILIINKDTEIKALWKDIMVSVSLVPGYGTGETIAKEVKKGTDYTLPECDFTAPTNKEFKSWSVNNEEKAVGETITVNEDTEVTATWKDKQIETVKVTLVANNDTDKTIVKKVKKGTDYTLPDCPFKAPKNKEFAGWKIGEDEKKPGDILIINKDTEVRAIWQAKPNESDPDETKPDEGKPDEENPDEDNPGEKPNPDKPSPDKPKQMHAINITPSPYCEVIIDSLEAKAGDKVTVRAIANYGYELVSLSVRDASGKLLPIINGEFIMPDGEVSIFPIFREIAPYINPKIYDKAEREEQKRRHRRDYYHEEENNEDDVKTIDKVQEEKQKESKVLITIGSEILDKVDNGVRTLKAMDTKPYIKGGRTMLPLRYVAEALGYRVAWLSETRTAVIMDIGLRVEIPVDSSFIIVNGVKYTSDVKPEMRKNRIMLPIANIARALGLKDGKDILWDDVNRQVTLIRNFNAK